MNNCAFHDESITFGTQQEHIQKNIVSRFDKIMYSPRFFSSYTASPAEKNVLQQKIIKNEMSSYLTPAT